MHIIVLVLDEDNVVVEEGIIPKSPFWDVVTGMWKRYQEVRTIQADEY